MGSIGTAGRTTLAARAGLLATAIALALSLLAAGSAGAQTPEPKVRKVALIRVAFQNAPNDVLGNIDQGRDTIFKGDRSVAGFLRYVSGNRFTLGGKNNANGDVFGPYTIAANLRETSSRAGRRRRSVRPSERTCSVVKGAPWAPARTRFTISRAGL